MEQHTKDTLYNEITQAYFSLIDEHLDHLVNGSSMHMLALGEIAEQLNVAHKQLITIVKTTMGNHPCYYYDQKIIDKTRQLLRETDWPVAKIALRLTYDPSNFSKFFRNKTGQTPGQYREQAHR